MAAWRYEISVLVLSSLEEKFRISALSRHEISSVIFESETEFENKFSSSCAVSLLPLDLVLVSCTANLHFVPNSKRHFEWLFFGAFQAREGKREASEERATRLSPSRVSIAPRPPKKEKKIAPVQHAT